MKLKFKLRILAIAIIAFLVTGISVLLLLRSSNISFDLSIRGIYYLAGKQADYYSCSQLPQPNMEIAITPFNIGNSGITWAVMIGAEESYMLTKVREITKFTVILAIIAIIAAAVILFIVVGYVTGPIVTVTETMGDISKGEGELTITQEISRESEKVMDINRENMDLPVQEVSCFRVN